MSTCPVETSSKEHTMVFATLNEKMPENTGCLRSLDNLTYKTNVIALSNADEFHICCIHVVISEA